MEKATRSLILEYTGCRGVKISYDENETKKLKFYVDMKDPPGFSQNTTYYMGFTSSDPRCHLSFRKHSNTELDSITTIKFKNSLREQGYYFNVTLNKKDPTLYIGKSYSFKISAGIQNETWPNT